MNEQERYELIDNYLQGNLTESEKQDFELLLQSDTQLQEDLCTLSDITTVLQTRQKLAQKQHWQQLLQQQGKEGGKTAVMPKKWSVTAVLLRVAALLVLIAGTYFVWQQTQSPKDMQQIALQQWQETQNITQWSSLRGTDTDTTFAKMQLTNAVKAYQQKNYEQAVSLAMAIPPQNTYYPDALLLSGMSYLEAQNAIKAILFFSQLLQPENDNLLKDQARWYLALAFLQNKQPIEARTQLTQIVTDKSLHYDRAAKILTHLPEK